MSVWQKYRQGRVLKPIEEHELACQIHIMLKKDGIHMPIKEIARRMQPKNGDKPYKIN